MSNKNIYYSNKYNDEKLEYHHVMLPKDFAKLVPKTNFKKCFPPPPPHISQVPSGPSLRRRGLWILRVKSPPMPALCPPLPPIIFHTTSFHGLNNYLIGHSCNNEAKMISRKKTVTKI